jgi:hypothetical protein
MTGRDRVKIDDAIERIMAFLQRNPVAHGAEVVAEMEGVRSRLDAGEHPGSVRHEASISSFAGATLAATLPRQSAIADHATCR